MLKVIIDLLASCCSWPCMCGKVSGALSCGWPTVDGVFFLQQSVSSLPQMHPLALGHATYHRGRAPNSQVIKKVGSSWFSGESLDSSAGLPNVGPVGRAWPPKHITVCATSYHRKLDPSGVPRGSRRVGKWPTLPNESILAKVLTVARE